MARHDAIGRVAIFFEMLEHQPSLRDDGTDLWLPMSRRDIANYLGLTQETLSRTIGRLTREGVVAFPDRTHVRIDDRSRLHALAEPH